jgi:hypothetical protein
MISGQQIIEEELSVKKVIDDKLYDAESEVIVPVGGQLCTNQVIPDTTKDGLRELSDKNAKDIRKVIVPVDGQLCKNPVILETTKECLKELR